MSKVCNKFFVFCMFFVFWAMVIAGAIYSVAVYNIDIVLPFVLSGLLSFSFVFVLFSEFRTEVKQFFDNILNIINIEMKVLNSKELKKDFRLIRDKLSSKFRYVDVLNHYRTFKFIQKLKIEKEKASLAMKKLAISPWRCY